MKTEIRTHLRSGAYEEALTGILRVTPGGPLEDIEYAAEALGKIPADIISSRAPLKKKLAVLGGATTNFMVPLIRLFALRRGVDLDIYQSDYGVYEQEIWDASPDLVAFKPDVIHFFVGTQNLSLRQDQPAETVREGEVRRFIRLYEAAAQRFDCAVLANNFTTEVARPHGSLDVTLPGSRNNLIRGINADLSRLMPARVF